MDAAAIIIGAGMSGMATAARLQAHGLSTLVLEAHGQVGGCAGFFRRSGFSFDVGATTLVDFGPEGVGGQLLHEIGLSLEGEALPGYCAWLPDRKVTLHRDPVRWHHERLAAFGDTPAHRLFWTLIDQLSEVFWTASRNGIKLPLRSLRDFFNAAQRLPVNHWRLARYLTWSMSDALQACRLADDKPLRSLLSMLLQDTVHATLDDAPLINSALGLTIRGAGLTRARGGMRGFWQALLAQYRALGGTVKVGSPVKQVIRDKQGFVVRTTRGEFRSRQVISTLPIWNTARLGLPEVTEALSPFLERNQSALGGAIVVFLGVPDEEVAGQDFTHHQILLDYDRPMGNGNNMFISISASNDAASGPIGWRAVMISTHCELSEWENLSADDHTEHRNAWGQKLIEYARRVYPNLGERARVIEVGTPRTYERYTQRYRGAVGGIRLNLHNSNQHAVPYDIGVPGFWQAGDTTWPGLGTVACVLSSRHVAEAVLALEARGDRGRCLVRQVVWGNERGPLSKVRP